MSKLKVLDLFSGIGGFSLGLERTGGFETIQFCEIDPYCQKVLRKHWPEVPIHDDVETFRPWLYSCSSADVVTAGFPCQDISLAGTQAGIDGERSGLWQHIPRILGEVRPRYAILENVSALLSGDRGRWFGRVLGDLAAIGYDAEWHCVQAADVGAPHLRDRVWMLVYPGGQRGGRSRPQEPRFYMVRDLLQAQRREKETDAVSRPNWWAAEPDVGRVANGIPKRVDRLRGLGNAIVPQIAELIGHAILAVEGAKG